MGDREYLYELALILDSTIPEQQHIKIDYMTAKDIAQKLREIVGRMTILQ